MLLSLGFLGPLRCLRLTSCCLLSGGTPCRAVGAFSWFPVHGTSMNNTNTLISGDNKGAAAQFMERWAAAQAAQAAQEEEAQQQQGPEQEQEQRRQQPGSGGGGQGVAAGGLVAAFCQANVGDTSPNTQGAFCADTGQPCDAVHSTCGGRVQQCIGRGPGWPDNFASTRIIGQAQADKAQELLLGGGESPPANAQPKHLSFAELAPVSGSRRRPAAGLFLTCCSMLALPIPRLYCLYCLPVLPACRTGGAGRSRRLPPRFPRHARHPGGSLQLHPGGHHLQTSHGVCLCSGHHRR